MNLKTRGCSAISESLKDGQGLDCDCRDPIVILCENLDLEIPDPRAVPRRESLTGGPGHSRRWRGDDEARAAADRATAVTDEWARGLDVEIRKINAAAEIRTRALVQI